jgi:TolA-binding protein
MSINNSNSEPINKINDLLDNANHYFEQYKNIILGGLAAVFIVFAGIFIYKNYIKAPKEAKAKDAIFLAQYLFAKDSFELALKGNGNVKGFENIIKNYGGTTVGNTARYYAGVCNLNLGKFTEAVKYLEEFKTDDPLIAARKFGCLGDAYAEQKQMEKAIENYKKAANIENEITAPTYMYRAALALDLAGKKEEALETYEKLNTTYPNSQEGQAAELAIGKLEQEVKK